MSTEHPEGCGCGHGIYSHGDWGRRCHGEGCNCPKFIHVIRDRRDHGHE